MKQTFAVIILVMLVIFGTFYFFIPTNNSVQVSQSMKVTPTIVQRMVGDHNYRKKWLPAEGKIVSPKEYLLDNCSFIFTTDMTLNNVVTVKYNDRRANSFLITLPQGNNSTASLNFTFSDTINGLARFSNYFSNKKIESATKKLLLALQNFTNDLVNVYGVEMKNAILKDSTLITIKSSSKQYPGIAEIYGKIDLLKLYAVQNDAKQTAPPMLNIYKENDSAYNFMVALPVDKLLEGTGEILAKRMLAGGNILESAEIKGGIKTVDYYLKELENFRADNAAISPAIPYQSLITDRQKETDTAKWITKLYFPVF